MSTDLKEKKTETAGEINARDAYPYRFLGAINSPEDLRKLSSADLPLLAAELRHFIVNSVSQTGGHLASSLGAVELAVALHYVFNTPDDPIVWDVGHQAYAHKILTGRREAMATLRQTGGISGFPKRSESPYDAFGTGHASTSVSAALGMAVASYLQGATERWHVAVIGDGALTGGMAIEALNDAGSWKDQIRLLIILNDNNYSISAPVGALSKNLTKLVSTPAFLGARERSKQVLSHLPSLWEFAKRFEKQAMNFVSPPSSLFSTFDLNYFGPIDGNDISYLVRVLQNLKTQRGPIVLHVVTKKGKGYELAEADPTTSLPFCYVLSRLKYLCFSHVQTTHPPAEFALQNAENRVAYAAGEIKVRFCKFSQLESEIAHPFARKQRFPFLVRQLQRAHHGRNGPRKGFFRALHHLPQARVRPAHKKHRRAPFRHQQRLLVSERVGHKIFVTVRKIPCVRRRALIGLEIGEQSEFVVDLQKAFRKQNPFPRHLFRHRHRLVIPARFFEIMRLKRGLPRIEFCADQSGPEGKQPPARAEVAVRKNCRVRGFGRNLQRGEVARRRLIPEIEHAVVLRGGDKQPESVFLFQSGSLAVFARKNRDFHTPSLIYPTKSPAPSRRIRSRREAPRAPP